MFGLAKILFGMIIRLDAGGLASKIWQDKDVQATIVELNTRKQLYDKGIDSLGKPLRPPYTPFTIDHKLDVGLPDDRVTLYETGAFHASFGVKPMPGGAEIVYDPYVINEDGEFEDLRAKYGQDIIGLTEGSKAILADLMREKMQILLKQTLKP